MNAELPNPDEIQEDLQEILRELGYGTSTSRESYIPVELIEVTAIILLAVFLLYFVFYVVNRSLFSVREPALHGKAERKFEEFLERKDYHALYRKAVDLGKREAYMEAVRMLYMALLLLLDSKEVFTYHPSLTNIEYRLKVHSYPFGGLFENVTHTFDLIYYGGKHATGADFSLCMNAFSDIEEALS